MAVFGISRVHHLFNAHGRNAKIWYLKSKLTGNFTSVMHIEEGLC